jgi:hypothetical protein
MPKVKMFNTYAIEGMSLRDYFAAQALVAVTINQGAIGTEAYTFEEAALDSYLIADAMVNERNKNASEKAQ